MRTRRLFSSIGAFLLFGALFGQEPSAVIRNYDGTFSMSSAKTGTYKVVMEVEVFDESGNSASSFVENTDSYISISSFSGSVSHKGKVLSKISKNDLKVQSLSSGLAEDNQTVYYSPSAPYPYTVKYEYTVSYKKGVAFFPTFMPVSDEKVTVDNASFTLEIPSGTQIQYYSSIGEPSFETKGNTDRHSWKVSGYKGFTIEHNMPSVIEIVPFVFAAPIDFMYGGTYGSQKNWNEVGKWLNSLQSGVNDLPEDFKAELREMTNGCKTTYEKVSVLYKYLRDNTRYVSIQYGLGGYIPAPASSVLKSGYGDCKALGNYMKSMLEAVGVPSDYVILNTDRAKTLPNLTSFGLMNHVMLAVPLEEQKDTLWVECTNPSYPLGYRHSGIAGHQVVLLREEGGVPMTVPSYPDSLRRDAQKTVVTLDQKGGATLVGHRDMYLNRTEAYLNFGSLAPDVQSRALTSAMKIHPDKVTVTGIGNNFGDYEKEGKGFCPHVWVDYSMSTAVYANSDGSRMFVPFNPVAQGMSFQRGTRIHDLILSSGSSHEDTVEVQIPEGYGIESLPEPVELHTEWGDFSATAEQKGEGTLEMKISYSFRPVRLPADKYDEYRNFARTVNRAVESKIVLVKE